MMLSTFDWLQLALTDKSLGFILNQALLLEKQANGARKKQQLSMSFSRLKYLDSANLTTWIHTAVTSRLDDCTAF